MKKQITILMSSAIFFLLLLNSCKKSDNPTSGAAALQSIKSDPSLSVFSAIESKAGDDALFTDGYAYIIPVDTAFNSAGITTATVSTMSQTACDSIVRYYIIPNGIAFGGATNTETAFGASLGNASWYADSTTNNLFFNGVPAISPIPTVVSQSLIYKLSQFVNFPVASLGQLTNSDPDLTFFNEALGRTNFVSNLTGASYTLFMPTNTAFMNAGYPDIASIDAADINTLTQILLYNTIGNRFFTNDISLVSSLPTLQGESINISLNGNSFQLVGTSDPGTPASIINNGVFGGNVLTYKVNQLLLP